jgi:hypothetical protein
MEGRFFKYIQYATTLWRSTMRVLFSMLIISLVPLFVLPPVLAGPPFVTDDPEPVEYRHWELYLAAQWEFNKDEKAGTAPHVEVNYGLIPNVQIHLIAPMMYVKEEGEPSHYGYGDTEIGCKYRFLQETDLIPQAGIFPLLVIPTGDRSNALGNGRTQAFIPLWLQKGWGPWKTYGGGGYWINPGEGNKNWWLIGWLVQRDISDKFTLGGEVFHSTPDTEEGESSIGFNVGGIINFNEMHHLLVSAGRDFSGPNEFSFYLGYQLTFGM